MRLPAPPRGAATVSGDQAIFTSIRSPMGEGYRIVVHSAGVRPEEKTEITRRSPSHGNLSSTDPNAIGLLAYPLPTGRFCIAHCCYAGKEHTARGGERVWTHVVLLDEAAYRQYGYNPLRVHRALAHAISPPQPVPKSLGPLTLPAWTLNESPVVAHTVVDVAPFICLMDLLARGGHWAASNAPRPLVALEWAYDLLPLPLRRKPAISWGLTFALSRRLNLVLTDGDQRGLERMIQGQDVTWCDLSVARPDPVSPLAAWYELVRAWTPLGRWAQIARMTPRIEASELMPAMGRIARLCLDLDRALNADEDEKAMLRDKYNGFAPRGDLEGEIFGRLQAATAPPPEPEDETDPMDD